MSEKSWIRTVDEQILRSEEENEEANQLDTVR